MTCGQTNPEETSILVVVIDDKPMGLRLQDIERVLPACELVEPPQVSPGLAGFLNDRGDMIPILRLREMLGLPAKPLRLSDQIVMARLRDGVVGLIVDNTLGVLAAGQVLGFSTKLETLNIDSTVGGFTRWNGSVIVVQNLERFLASSVAGIGKIAAEADSLKAHQSV